MSRRSPRLAAGLVAMFIVAWVARNEATDTFGQYGDYYQLINLVQTEEHFPRWLIGTEILRGAYRVTQRFQDTSPPSFVKQASGLWHLVAGIAVLLAFPSWAAFFALTGPLMLHFGTGYSEYYPFIAPLFVAVALGHVDRAFDGLPPWIVGAGCGLLLMFYVGFLPLAILVGACAVSQDVRRAAALLASAVATCLVISTAIVGVGFWPQLWHDLNVGDLAAYPEQTGWAIPGTPFFRPGHAVEHLPAFLGAVSRTVGIGPMLAGLVLSFRNRRLALLIWVYALVSLFTIPRLGMLGDTDLYFQLYALAGLSIGWALDQVGDASRAPTSESNA